LSSLSGAVRRVLLPHWKTRKVRLRNAQPVISFTFDDFPRTALLAGGEILQKYGARGTYYTAMGLVGITNHEGAHFTPQDLRDLLRDGHELGSHSYSHVSALSAPLEAFQADVLRGEGEVASLRGSPTLGVTAAGNFSYPFGDVTFACKQDVGSRLRSCRGIRGGVMTDFADLNLLLANRLYSNSFRLDSVQKLIAENQKRRGWLIFYTHDVRENPSDFGCTPEQFESVVRGAAQSGARLLTVSEALDAIQAAA
jgi:peptidoglycan/xylan/chitin deacetylase (PgdA/CDA1 family)